MSARTREKVLAAAGQSGLGDVLNETGDRPRDQFDRDGVQVTVDYELNGDIRKAWVTVRVGERVIDGTSKAREVISYLRTGFIGAVVEQRGRDWRRLGIEDIAQWVLRLRLIDEARARAVSIVPSVGVR